MSPRSRVTADAFRRMERAYGTLARRWAVAAAARGGGGIPIEADPVRWARTEATALADACKAARQDWQGSDSHGGVGNRDLIAVGIEALVERGSAHSVPDAAWPYLVRWTALWLPERTSTVLAKLAHHGKIERIDPAAGRRMRGVAAGALLPPDAHPGESASWSNRARRALEKNCHLLSMDALRDLVARVTPCESFADALLRREAAGLEDYREVAARTVSDEVRATLLRHPEARTDPAVRDACRSSRDRMVLWRLLAEAEGEELRELFGRCLGRWPRHTLSWLTDGHIGRPGDLRRADLAAAMRHPRGEVRKQAVLALGALERAAPAGRTPDEGSAKARSGRSM